MSTFWGRPILPPFWLPSDNGAWEGSSLTPGSPDLPTMGDCLNCKLQPPSSFLGVRWPRRLEDLHFASSCNRGGERRSLRCVSLPAAAPFSKVGVGAGPEVRSRVVGESPEAMKKSALAVAAIPHASSFLQRCWNLAIDCGTRG